MQVSIIGSFRKFYDGVIKIIDLFEANGLKVLSPKRSEIINPEEEFVVFKTDNVNYNPVQIQLIALNRILRSNFVYVWNPNGYLGRTTSYEIGRIIERKIPLYFSEIPKDLPLFLYKSNIWEPNALIKYINLTNTLPPYEGVIYGDFAEKLNNNLTC